MQKEDTFLYRDCDSNFLDKDFTDTDVATVVT